MRQNNEEYELGTVEVIVNKVEKTLTKVIFSDYLGTIEYTLTYGEGGQIEKIGYTVEAEGETPKDDKWTKIINGMTIYTDTALKEYLEQAGFCQIQSHKSKKGWLCVTAQKR